MNEEPTDAKIIEFKLPKKGGGIVMEYVEKAGAQAKVVLPGETCWITLLEPSHRGSWLATIDNDLANKSEHGLDYGNEVRVHFVGFRVMDNAPLYHVSDRPEWYLEHGQ